MDIIRKIRNISTVFLASIFVFYFGYYEYLSQTGISAEKITEIYTTNFFLLIFFLGFLSFLASVAFEIIYFFLNEKTKLKKEGI